MQIFALLFILKQSLTVLARAELVQRLATGLFARERGTSHTPSWLSPVHVTRAEY